MHIIRPAQHYGYSVLNSGLFDGTSGYLTWTPGSAGDRKTASFSWWEKINTTANNMLFYAHTDANNFHYIYRSGSQIVTLARVASVDKVNITWTPFYRDPTAWSHFFITIDATDDMKLYVNGEEVTARTVTTAIVNEDLWFSNMVQHTIGYNPIAAGQHIASYMAEMHFTNHGSLNTVDEFGEFDEYGVWIPKRYTGSYGSNGFYLDFYRSGNLGFDRINGNSFTTNGTITQSKDSPTDFQVRNRSNFDTFSQLFVNGTSSTLSNGNKTWTTATASGKRGTLGLSSGKFNLPFKINLSGSSVGSPGPRFGLIGISATAGHYPGAATGPEIAIQVTDTTVYKYVDGSIASIGTGGGTTNDVFALEVDFDTDTVTLYKNGAFFGTVVTGHLASDTTWFASVGYSGAATYPIITYENSPTEWSYSPSNAVFKALCTSSAADVTEVLSDHFNTVLYTGNGAENAITGVGFQPDFVWIKTRSDLAGSAMFDAVRGSNKELNTNDAAAEATRTDTLNSFDVDGFTLGADATATTVNVSARTYVAWCARLPSDEINSSGDITVTWKYNAVLGMAIGTYTGTGVAGHTLGIPAAFGKAPFHIIIKDRTAATAQNWCHYSSALGANKYLIFTAASAFTDTVTWNNTAPTSSEVTLGTYDLNNGAGKTYVAILFFETNFCRSVSYTCNGNSDGPYIHLNGLSSWLLVKNTSIGTSGWAIYDTVRRTFNPNESILLLEASSAEVTANNHLDLLTTGIKLRNAQQTTNNSTNFVSGIAIVEPIGISGPGQRRPL